MAAGARQRSQWMRVGGKMAGADNADLMKPQRGICDLVKPRAAKSMMKPTSDYSAEEPWIYVRGCRIARAGLRFNSQGDVYVPDSEDEEEALEVSANGPVGVDLAPAVAADGPAGVDLAPALAADGASGVDLALAVAADGPAGIVLATAPVVATDGAASVEMKLEVAARLAKKVLGEDLHPKVAALLAEVLSKMEPVYHDSFIDMYKVMVLIFFIPAP